MPPLEDCRMSEEDHEEEEEDLVIQSSKPSLKCPLTQKLLEDPVKKYSYILHFFLPCYVVLNVDTCFQGLQSRLLPSRMLSSAQWLVVIEI